MSSTVRSVSGTGEIVAHVFGRTDVGRMRDHNEDTFMVADLAAEGPETRHAVHSLTIGQHGILFVVADGLGGAAAGELASQIAVDTIFQEMRRDWCAGAERAPERFAAALKGATETANARINAYALEHPDKKGMGTTATIAGLLHDSLYVVQVGDSRAYLVRDGRMRQITKDQSLMQRLIDAGELTQEEAERSERRNIILQALGPEPAVRVDLTCQQVRHGDALILCTDGLYGQVSRVDMEQLIEIEPDLVTLCDELVDRANESGGPDNITVLAARFAGRGLPTANGEDSIGHVTFPVLGLQAPSFPLDEMISPVSGHTSMQDAVTETPGRSRGGRRRSLVVVMLVLLGVAAILGIVATAPTW